MWKLFLVVLAVSLASFTHLLNLLGIDDWLERLQLEQMEYSVAARSTPSLHMLYIDEKDTLENVRGNFAQEEQLWRRQHALFLQALANAPKFVAFDLTFPSPNDGAEYQSANAEMVKAVQSATTSILLGADLRNDDTPDLLDAFKDVAWGWVHVGGKRLEHGASTEYVRKYVLARSKLPANVAVSPEDAYASLAVMMRILEKSPSSKARPSVRLDTKARRLILYAGDREIDRISCTIESDETGHNIATMPLRYGRRGFGEGDSYVKELKRLSSLANEYKGQIVLIGVKTERERCEITPQVKAYGYQLHASVFSDLSRNTYPRTLPGWANLSVLLLLGAIAGFGRSSLPKSDIEVDTKVAGKRKLPAGLIVLLVLYAIVVWIFYRSASVLFDVGYGAVAVIASYYYCGAAPALSAKPSENEGT